MALHEHGRLRLDAMLRWPAAEELMIRRYFISTFIFAKAGERASKN